MRSLVGIVTLGMAAGIAALLALRYAPARAMTSAQEVLAAAAPSALHVPRELGTPSAASAASVEEEGAGTTPVRSVAEKDGPPRDAKCPGERGGGAARPPRSRRGCPRVRVASVVGCDGPRRAPVSTGENLARAERFELLGSPLAGLRPCAQRPPPIRSCSRRWEAGAKHSLQWPVPAGVRGRGFGYVRRAAIGGRLHRGVDIPAEVGAAVVATNRALVVYADNGVRGYGNLVVLLHAGRHPHALCPLGPRLRGRGPARGAGENASATWGERDSRTHPICTSSGAGAPCPEIRAIASWTKPDAELEAAYNRGQLERRRAGEARLAALRERVARRRG